MSFTKWCNFFVFGHDVIVDEAGAIIIIVGLYACIYMSRPCSFGFIDRECKDPSLFFEPV